MLILGLDLSTKTGYGLIDSDGRLVDYGVYHVDGEESNHQLCDEYHIFFRAQKIANIIHDQLVVKLCPDYIFIEQTNLGNKRETQKLLEFIHYCVLEKIFVSGKAAGVHYVDTSRWKSTLEIRMNKEDRQHNKLVKTKKARGKITSKHLSVRWANDKYNLNLKLKDNDAADAIALATYGMVYLKSLEATKSLSNKELNKALDIK